MNLLMPDPKWMEFQAIWHVIGQHKSIVKIGVDEHVAALIAGLIWRITVLEIERATRWPF